MATAILTLQDTCHTDFRHARLTPYNLRTDQLHSLVSRFDKSVMAGKRLIDSCVRDDQALGRIDVLHETLSKSLRSRISNPAEGDMVVLVRGIEVCPFEECDAHLQSTAITLARPELDISLWFSHVLVHLALEHAFFGYSPDGLPGMSRMAPLDLAVILGLTDRTSHMATTREIYGNEMAWKNGFKPIKIPDFPPIIHGPGQGSG